MPDIPVGYGQINYVLALAGDNEEMIVTMGVWLNPTESTDDVAIINAAMTNFADAYKGGMCNVYTIKRADGYFNRGAGNIVVSSTLPPIACTVAGNALPQNCAYLFKKLTGIGGRTGKGRFFLPGVPEAEVDAAGNVQTGSVTAFGLASIDYLNDMSAILGVNSCVLLHSDGATIPNPITAITLDSKLATQRRRLR